MWKLTRFTCRRKYRIDFIEGDGKECVTLSLESSLTFRDLSLDDSPIVEGVLSIRTKWVLRRDPNYGGK